MRVVPGALRVRVRGEAVGFDLSLLAVLRDDLGTLLAIFLADLVCLLPGFRQGSANTTPFVIGGPGRWKVAWSYDCGGKAPGLTIRQAPAPPPASPAASGLSVTSTGASGHGVAWADNDPGQHALRIRTACTWHLAVTSYS